MIEHPDVIPIAVVAAVLIFFARELLEGIRRHRVDRRKLDAVRRLLAAECQRNYFAHSRLLTYVDAVEEARLDEDEISIEPRQRGIPLLKIEKNGELFHSSPLFPVRTAALEKYLFDVASLDADLFALMEAALDVLTEVAHVRDSLIEYVSDDHAHLEGFADYAKGELDDALDPLCDLYFKCTGEPLAQGRVR